MAALASNKGATNPFRTLSAAQRICNTLQETLHRHGALPACRAVASTEAVHELNHLLVLPTIKEAAHTIEDPLPQAPGPECFILLPAAK